MAGMHLEGRRDAEAVDYIEEGLRLSHESGNISVMAAGSMDRRIRAYMPASLNPRCRSSPFITGVT